MTDLLTKRLLGLELRLLWGDQLVAEHFLKPGAPATFTVGSAAGVSFAMGTQRHSGEKFEVVQSDTQSFTLRFTHEMNGELRRRGEQVMSLRRAVEGGIAMRDRDGHAISLRSGDRAWVDLGGIVLEVFFQPVPKPVIVPFAGTIDYTALNVLLVLFFFAGFFIVAALNRDREGVRSSDELFANQRRLAKFVLKPPEPRESSPLEQISRRRKDQTEVTAKRHGHEGQMGRRDAPKRSAHAAPKGDADNKDHARRLVQVVLGSRGGGFSTVWGRSGLGGGLREAIGDMLGAAPGNSRGVDGWGLRGSSQGGGGLDDTIGIGVIGTKGRGGGIRDYGSDVDLPAGKPPTVLDIPPSEITLTGALDKELIRQVIRRNINQIKYCYESQLTRHPNLSGKVAVQFVISASGSVASSSVVQSSADDRTLESCVANRVHGWLFPKPRGGGVVVVTYPFLFKPAGE